MTLSPPSIQTVTVTYSTADGTATAPSDYAAQSGTLTFPPGETVQTIFVQYKPDTVPEFDETFFVNLTSATNAVIVKGQGIAIIINDDGVLKVTLKVTPPVDFDGDGKSDIGVYRDGAWFILQSSDGRMTSVGWGGTAQDIPVPADYDGDGKADVAVYREGIWFVRRPKC